MTTNRRKGLGSGFDALLPSDLQGGVREIPIQTIRQNPRQPRTSFDEAALDDLAASIREHGIIQPLIVSERDDGVYELVAGERRWRAAQRAGISRVPVVIRETTQQQLLELALIENVQRADLNPIEEARAYQSLVDDFGLSDNQIAQRVGKNNRVSIANTRRLLKLPQQVQDAILKNSISAGHGRALLRLEIAEHQLMAMEAVIAHNLSVRETELLSDLANGLSGNVQQALTLVRPKTAPRSSELRTTGRTSTEQPMFTKRPASKRPLPPERIAPKQSMTERRLNDADNNEIAAMLERLVGTPVSVSRVDDTWRVTFVFHGNEKVGEFLSTLKGQTFSE